MTIVTHVSLGKDCDSRTGRRLSVTLIPNTLGVTMTTQTNGAPDLRSGRLDRSKMKKIALASVIGTTVEWYDLFLFATASALVFGKVFFPELNPAVGTILSFLTFASAYLARMIG